MDFKCLNPMSEEYRSPSTYESSDKVIEILNESSVHYDELGVVTEKDMIIDDKSKVTIDELIGSNTNWLTNYMSK